MKNSLTYLKLWQKKRSELPVDETPQEGWMHMQSLLDTHLPVVKPVVKVKPPHSGYFKFLTWFVATAAAATTIYYTAHQQSTSSKHKHPVKVKTTLVTTDTSVKDSVNPARDSVNVDDSAVNKVDSADAIKQPAAKADSAGIKAAGSKAIPTANKGIITLVAATSKSLTTRSVGNKSASLNISSKNAGSKSNMPGNKPTGGFIAPIKSSNGKYYSVNGSSGIIPRINTHIGNYLNKSAAYHSKLIYGKPGQRPLVETGNLQQAYNATINAFNQNLGFNADVNPSAWKNKLFNNKSINGTDQSKIKGNAANKNNKRAKAAKQSAAAPPSNLDWGIMLGINTNGSFTPKSQNSNVYDSFPVDAFVGLFANYNLIDKWAVGTQLHVLSPQKVSGSYTHTSLSTLDSGKLLTIKDSRKVYLVQVPVFVEYKVNDVVHIKAGPVFSIPIKQVNGSNSILPDSIKKDSAYYSSLKSAANKASYLKMLNYGISAGVSIHVKRLILEATYVQNFNGKVTSDLGTYKANNGTLQITVGFKLNRIKKQ